MKNPLQLGGKTILVTGASSGIGRATAILLGELGARVVLAARNEQRLRETSSAMPGGQHCVEIIDLNDLDRIPKWFRELIAKTGALDGIVHCAGVSSLMPLRTMTTQHLEAIMRINFYAAVSLVQELSRKEMYRPGAAVVLVSSIAGIVGMSAQTAYSSSKGALIAFTRSAAVELARQNIRVNCIVPGVVVTEILEGFQGMSDQVKAKAEATHPLGLGSPVDVANAIAFLLAETSRWITGSILVADGGYTAQ